MSDHGLPILFAVFLWWFSTGAILWLDGRPARTFKWSMAGASVFAVLGLWGIVTTAQDGSVAAAYWAFLSALALWGWIEMSFLMGFITGTHQRPCPPEARGWQRFKLAATALLWHELAIALTAAGLLWLTWGAVNQTGALSFCVLMIMRLSTKLNIFLGVANIAEEFLPEHLRYLKSYFRKRELNPLFPVSVVASIWVALTLAEAAAQAPSGSGAAVGYTLVFTLVALAILEHGFLMARLPDTELWRWALTPSRGEPPVQIEPVAQPAPLAPEGRPLGAPTQQQ
jgi:putative photosynthetic complex assembly protein 2